MRTGKVGKTGAFRTATAGRCCVVNSLIGPRRRNPHQRGRVPVVSSRPGFALEFACGPMHGSVPLADIRANFPTLGATKDEAVRVLRRVFLTVREE